MKENEWIKEFPAAITVCDAEGILLEMNDRAAKSYEKDGGRKLIGSNMLDCHPEPARTRTERLLAAREKNVYVHHRKEWCQEIDLSIALVPQRRVCRVRGTLA